LPAGFLHAGEEAFIQQVNTGGKERPQGLKPVSSPGLTRRCKRRSSTVVRTHELTIREGRRRRLSKPMSSRLEKDVAAFKIE
jgi:hypothetical protein